MDFAQNHITPILKGFLDFYNIATDQKLQDYWKQQKILSIWVIWDHFRLLKTKIEILGLLHSQMGPGVTPKVLPWDKKIIVPKCPYNALLLPPMVREHFSKKPKNRIPDLPKSGGF